MNHVMKIRFGKQKMITTTINHDNNNDNNENIKEVFLIYIGFTLDLNWSILRAYFEQEHHTKMFSKY